MEFASGKTYATVSQVSANKRVIKNSGIRMIYR